MITVPITFGYALKNGKYVAKFHKDGSADTIKMLRTTGVVTNNIFDNTITADDTETMKSRCEEMVERFRLMYKLHSVKFSIEYNQLV